MIRGRYPNVRGIRTLTIEMEPGSPWHLEPEEYGVKTSLNNFMDFYHYHSGDKNAFSSLGYWIPDYFDEERDEKGFEEALQKIKCRHFCFIHPEARKSSTPFWGRRLCDLSSLCWKVKCSRKSTAFRVITTASRNAKSRPHDAPIASCQIRLGRNVILKLFNDNH